MATSYRDYIGKGMSKGEAAQNQALRTMGRDTVTKLVTGAEKFAAGVAFGMLDAIAVKLVGWYGPKAAAEVFEHYAAVCGRQAEGGENAQG